MKTFIQALTISSMTIALIIAIFYLENLSGFTISLLGCLFAVILITIVMVIMISWKE